MIESEKRDERIIQWGLYFVALSCVLAAIGHCVSPDRIDDKTAMFLGLAAGVLIIREISKIRLPGGVIIEKVRRELKEVEKKVSVIETSGLLPGRPESVETTRRRSTVSSKDLWNSDPHKGQFGGSPQANGRVLEAEIKPAAGPRSSACHVFLRVRSTDPSRPLSGKVTFFLHPTFRDKPQVDVAVVEGIAEYRITSWGWFTVGAAADDGKTRLELDLRNVPGGTKKFYKS